MTDELDKLNAEGESLQAQKLKKLNQLAMAILGRRLFWFLLLFIACFALAAGMLLRVNKKSLTRCQASTSLIFYPKSTSEIAPLDNTQVMRIITQRNVLVKVAQNLGINEFDMSSFLNEAYDIQRDAKNQNYYSITAFAAREEDAIQRANAYADMAMREYSAFRLDDLYTRRVSVETRRAEIDEEFVRIDEEEKALNAEYGVVSAPLEAERLAYAVGEKKKELAQKLFELSEANGKLKKAQEGLGNISLQVFEEENTFRMYSEKLKKCNEEIEKLAFDYTEENPKLAVALEEREKISAAYNALLEKYGMTNEVTEVDFARIHALAQLYSVTIAEVERLESSVKSQENSIAVDEAKLNDLLKILPRYEGFKMRRSALKERLNTVEASFSDIRFLETSVKQELVQLDRADSASTEPAFGRKKVIAIFFISLMATAMLALLSVVVGIKWGKIHDEEEFDCYPNVDPLGTMGESDVYDEDAFNRFLEALDTRRKVFMVSLDKKGIRENFLQQFLLMCTNVGLKCILVDIVNAREHTPGSKDEMLVSICYHKEHGSLPVRNTAGLHSMEIAMLKVDLAKLLSKYDLVIMKTPDGRCSDLLTAQLTRVCDARLAIVHPRKTRRSRFRKLLGISNGFKTMALAVKAFVAMAALSLLTGCYMYSERLTGNYEQYPLLIEQENTSHAVVELDEHEKEEQLKFLMALEEEPPEEYRINAGDRVKFIVYDHPELCTDATVTPDGNIGIIFLGQVKISNLTLKEACDLIQAGLSKYIKKPMVSITPLEVVSQHCTISGGVRTPGVYPVSSDMRLSELYALAGGSAVRRLLGDDLNIADFSSSYIFRDGKPLPVDFNKAINEGNIYHNVRLKKNDRVVIGSRSEEMVCVVGHVKRPSKQVFDQSIGLIEVLTNAGWLEEEYWPNIIIIRGGVADPHIYRVDIDAILAGKSPNVQLQSGDVVYVPHDDISEFNVYIRKLLPLGQLFNLLTTPINYVDD